jgi:outer membrane protein TolC
MAEMHKRRSLLLVSAILLSLFSFSQQKTLDYYIGEALQNSPLLKDYQNQVQSNLIDSQKILSIYKPQVNASSFNSYAPVISGYGYDGAITNGGTFATLVDVRKTLVSKKNINTQFENIRLQNEALMNTSKISEQDLKKVVIAQYISSYGDQLQLNYNSEIYELLKNEEAILKTLTEKNVYNQADYLTFLVTLQQQQLSLNQLKIQYRNGLASLNYLCGIIDSSLAELQSPDISKPNLPELPNSVFFHQFEIDSLKLSNSNTLIDYGYKAKVSLFADAGFNSSLAYTPYKNFGTSFGIGITVPIYDGKQRQLQHNKIGVAEKTRSNYKDFFTNQYIQEIIRLNQQLRATEDLLVQIKGQIKYSEALITANGKLLQAGQVRIADYIIAINNYLNAKYLLAQNSVARLQIINQINYWNR